MIPHTHYLAIPTLRSQRWWKKQEQPMQPYFDLLQDCSQRSDRDADTHELITPLEEIELHGGT